MPRTSYRPVRIVRVVTGILLVLALAGMPVAHAEPPSRLDTYVEDRANALSGGEPDRVRSAVDQLYADHQVRLWIVYVEDFGGSSPEAWAERTAELSRFRERDVLLAVATGAREYALVNEPLEGVSDSEIDELLIGRVEPALRESRWADAGIVTADGLNAAMRRQGASGWMLLILATAVVAIVVGLVVFSRKRRRDRAASELDVARTLDPDNSVALAALSLETLHARSREVLVEIDDAVRTSDEELRLAVGEFGTTATTPFTRALDDARTAAAEAFRIRQRLDDAVPETPEEQRALLVQLLGIVGRADRELDARVAEFDAMRDLLIDAPARLDSLTRALVELTARIPASEAEWTRLSAAHPASTLTSIRDNVAMARERITFAENTLDAGRAELARPVGQQGGVVAAIRAAEGALGQAGTLLDGVDHAAADIQQARDGLPAVLEELRADIASAAELAGYGGEDLAATRDSAQQTLEAASSAADTDPLGAYRAASAADDALDRAVAAATDRKLADEDLRRRLERALTDARGRVDAATNFVTTRRGAVDASARTRLSEAQRHLDAAREQAQSDPAKALEQARTAADLAGRALDEAQDSVRTWEAAQAPSGSAQAGAVLGGILIDGLLRGAVTGGRHGGYRGPGNYRAGSYGGSGGSRRVSRGGRF